MNPGVKHCHQIAECLYKLRRQLDSFHDRLDKFFPTDDPVNQRRTADNLVALELETISELLKTNTNRAVEVDDHSCQWDDLGIDGSAVAHKEIIDQAEDTTELLNKMLETTEQIHDSVGEHSNKRVDDYLDPEILESVSVYNSTVENHAWECRKAIANLAGYIH